MSPNRPWCSECQSQGLGWVEVDAERYLATLPEELRDPKLGYANSAKPCRKCNPKGWDRWMAGGWGP